MKQTEDSNYPITPRLKARFQHKIELRSPRGCFLWKGATYGRGGYGMFFAYGKRWPAHRAAWAIAHNLPLDQVPSYVSHRCGNRSCVNTEHLTAEGYGRYASRRD